MSKLWVVWVEFCLLCGGRVETCPGVSSSSADSRWHVRSILTFITYLPDKFYPSAWSKLLAHCQSENEWQLLKLVAPK